MPREMTEAQREAARIRARAWHHANKQYAAERNRAYREANSERLKEVRAEWYRENRDAITESHRVYNQKNAEKVSAYHEAYRERNQEKIRAYRKVNKDERARIQENRRAREIGGGVLSRGLSKRLLALQRGKCASCSNDLANGKHLDHIMPLARGGAHEDHNIQLLCPRCNLKKRAKDPIAWANENGRLL